MAVEYEWEMGNDGNSVKLLIDICSLNSSRLIEGIELKGCVVRRAAKQWSLLRRCESLKLILL